MKKEEYSFWDDPKNKEFVERVSWWNHDKNKETFPLPISVIESENSWTASFNDETKEIMGEDFKGICGSGKTKDEAISQMFTILKISYSISENCRLRYQRWVPLRVGPWKLTGGKWVTIYGINIFFRRGKNMRGGFYIPFTNLNISISSEWASYRRRKQKLKSKYS